MKRIAEFIKKDVVLIIAIVLGVVGLIIAKPSFSEAVGFIDIRVLAILLGLMLVMEGFKSTGLFAFFAKKLIGMCGSTRTMELVLIVLCFTSSMLITNDVALITFVPFAIETLKISERKERVVAVVVYQTIAANLGSMLTPLGNPQNLYLFGKMGSGIGEFMVIMLPYTLLAALGLAVFFFGHKRVPIEKSFTLVDDDISFVPLGKEERRLNDSEKKNSIKNILYAVLFVVCLLCVLKVIPYYVMIGVVVVAVLIIDRRLMLRADYSLLFTFIGFFLFIGSMGKIPVIHQFLSSVVSGREMILGVALSQIISNVPAALLLGDFSKSLSDLLIGVNIGGLGTLIASMASLISYKQIVKNMPEEKGHYFGKFTLVNIVFLALEIGLYFVMRLLLIK